MAMKGLVKLREDVKKRKPKFMRYLSDRIKKISRSGYRKPRGIHNKMRKRIFGKPKMPCSGYGGPKKARHLHPSGYREVLVYTLKDLEKIDKEKEAVRIASCVGTKKRLQMLEKAKELGIKVLNPKVKRRAYLKLESKKEMRIKKEEEEKKEENVEKSVKKEMKKDAKAEKMKNSSTKKRKVASSRKTRAKAQNKKQQKEKG